MAEQTALTLNAKEFLAAEISQLLALKDNTSPYPCHLNIGDSTVAIGDSAVAEARLYKSNHVAREMASNLMKNKASNYSQHLNGIENIVADSLSRNTHLNNEQLLALLTTASPSLLPKNAQILPLSNQITSWIALLAQLPHKNRELRWQHTPSSLAAGITGWTFCQRSQQMIPTLTNSHKTKEAQSCVFMDTVRNGEFSSQHFDTVRGCTASQAADNEASAIESSGRPDPRKAVSGKTCLNYKRQFNTYKSQDGPTKHQKALPPEVFRWWLRNANHPQEKARATYYSSKPCSLP
jgi:hypothetical protein